MNPSEYTIEELIKDLLPPTIPNVELQLDETMDCSKEIVHSSPTKNTCDETPRTPPIEIYKRPISDSSSSKYL